MKLRLVKFEPGAYEPQVVGARRVFAKVNRYLVDADTETELVVLTLPYDEAVPPGMQRIPEKDLFEMVEEYIIKKNKPKTI